MNAKLVRIGMFRKESYHVTYVTKMQQWFVARSLSHIHAEVSQTTRTLFKHHRQTRAKYEYCMLWA